MLILINFFMCFLSWKQFFFHSFFTTIFPLARFVSRSKQFSIKNCFSFFLLFSLLSTRKTIGNLRPKGDEGGWKCKTKYCAIFRRQNYCEVHWKTVYFQTLNSRLRENGGRDFFSGNWFFCREYISVSGRDESPHYHKNIHLPLGTHISYFLIKTVFHFHIFLFVFSF